MNAFVASPSLRPIARVQRRNVIAGLVALLACSSAGVNAQPTKLDAPNVVVISERLVTSGQPKAAALQSLAALGFGAVIYLAPFSVPDAVKTEAEIVQSQGLAFINIPINFNSPTEADFESFEAALQKLGDKKVLVHCQVNMRASSMTFLHRVITNKEPPQAAYEAVSQVWSPRGPWKALLVAVLRKNQIAFEPY